MSHGPLKSVSELLDRINDEALEVTTENNPVDKLVEVLDCFGWLEAALFDDALAPEEKNTLRILLRAAIHKHARKCYGRGLVPLNITYAALQDCMAGEIALNSRGEQ